MANTISIQLELEGKDALTAVKKLEKGFDNFSKSATDGVKKVDGALNSFVGNLGAIAATRAFDFLVGQINNGVQAFIDFEDGLTAVAKTTNFTNDEVQQFAGIIDDLAKRLPVSTNELLEIATAAGQLGVSGTRNVAKFTETIAKLGEVSDLQGDFAATTLTRILNVTGEGIDTIDTFASVIVSLGNNFAATESEIANITNEVARATAQFNVGAAEAAALGTALRATGIRAEEAGGVLTKSFIRIDEAIRAGGEGLRDLERITGLTGEQIRTQFGEEPVKLFRNFVAGLNEIGKSGGSVTAELDRLGIQGIRVSKLIPTLANNVGEFDRALSLANAEVQNATALNNEYEQILDNTSTKITLFKNTVTELAREILGNLAPAFNNVLDVTTAFLQTFTADTALEEAQAKVKGLEATIKDVETTTKGVNGILPEFLANLNSDFGADRVARLKQELAEAKKEVNALSGDTSSLVATLKGELKTLEGDEGLATTIYGSKEGAQKRKEEILAQLKNLEQQAILSGEKVVEETKRQAEEKTNAEVNAAVVTNDLLSQIRQAKKDVKLQEREEEKLQKQLEGEEDLQFLTDNLGKENAARELARIENIENEKTKQKELRKLIDKAREQERASLLNLRQFENLTNQEKVKAQKETLQTIAGLTSSNNDALFAIGKASSLTLAGINVAEGVTKALSAFPPPFNFAAAAAVGAAGAIQISQIASAKKPSAGSFAEGGIVGGNSPTGDRLQANVNSGEVIFNKRQQQNLFNAVDSGNLGGGGNNITINNPTFLNEEGVDTVIDLINDRVEFGNQTLKTQAG
jgi:TP901 family phage tail tape measure protein